MNNVPPRPPGDADPTLVPAPTAADPAGSSTRTFDGDPAGAGPMPAAVGEYVILRKLGEGGMGAVYLAEDPKLGRKAAVKVMKADPAARKEGRDRFVREARAAAAVEHDNIVPVWGVGEAADGSPYIVMPFLQGEALEARLKREGASSPALVVAVGLDVATGLAAAHAKGIVHRDLKPANVWLEGDPQAADPAKQVRRAKVLDFGLARTAEPTDDHLTATGTIVGTPAYMSPQQASGDPVDHRTDLWSLGVTMYRMAVGRQPYGGKNAMAVLNALANHTPPPVATVAPHLPPALAALIDRLMRKDPNERPQTADEVVDALRALAAGALSSRPVPVLVLPAPPADVWGDVTEAGSGAVVRGHVTPPVPTRRLAWLLAGLLGFGLLCAALAAVVWYETAGGTVAVDLSAPEAEGRFRKLVLHGPDGRERYALTPDGRSKKVAAGAYTVTVEGDGLVLDAGEVTIKRNGEATVRVTFDPKKAKKPDPLRKEPDRPGTTPAGDDARDRAAAVWVLNVGGRVTLDGRGPEVVRADDLPKEPFRLVKLWLPRLNRPSDPAALRGLTALTHFHSADGGDGLDDALLLGLADSAELVDLVVETADITDAGLAVLKDKPQLALLCAHKTKVTDAGLDHLANSPRLDTLNVSGSPGITDACFPKLLRHKRLTFLAVNGTKVTEQGVKEFAKAMPRCRVVWDGGTIEPSLSPDPDRAAAEWVLGLGGGMVSVSAGGDERKVVRAADLPKEPFRLTDVSLPHFERPPQGVAALRGLTALAHFGGAGAAGPGFDDSVLLAIDDSAELKTVFAPYSAVTDAGLAALKDKPRLGYLNLHATKVTDAGLDRLANSPRLRTLNLSECDITDAGLRKLTRHAALADLLLNGTKVTERGVEEFARLMPQCKIDWNGRSIMPRRLDREAAERVLNAGGWVHIDGNRPFGRAADLPNGEFRLTEASFREREEVRDDDLRAFRGCPDVEHFDLFRCRKVTDAGLAHFASCTRLKKLSADATQLTDAGLAVFAGCGELTEVYTSETQLTDAGLAHLKGCKKLTFLGVARTKVTEAAANRFAAEHPGCKVVWGPEVTIEPTSK
jgi:tRNA A-37 threonylcarbamoyl transferase component Bud32